MGPALPPNGQSWLPSSYNYLWFTFVTDGSVQNRGFQLNYTTFEVTRVSQQSLTRVQVCSGSGGILRESVGVISSPRQVKAATSGHLLMPSCSHSNTHMGWTVGGS